jgi:hypothetical protein
MSFWERLARKLSGAADLVRAGLKGSEKVEDLEVFGSEDFRLCVRRALHLLRDHDLPAWETMTQHVDSIVEGRRTTIIVTAHPAFMFIQGPDWGRGPEVLAADIAFMACSCQLHRTYEARFPGLRVPRDIYAGSDARVRCSEAYQECLVALGGGDEGGGRSSPFLN